MTRAADSITTLGSLNTILTTLPQSVYGDAIWNNGTAAITGYWRVVGASSGTNMAYLQNPYPETAKVSMYDGSVTLTATFGGSLTWQGGVKVASGQSSGGRSLVGGGGTVATDAFSAVSTSPAIGRGTDANSTTYGYIRRLAVWNSRLADATLQALTAP